MDLVGQYARFAKYNNYDEYYKTFKRNNGALGVEIRIPFLNKAQKDHSEAAYAEALRSRKDVDTAKAQLDENDKYSALLDYTYQLEKAQMQLLKETGDLENWALSK